MIISRTPMRASLFGGGSDIQEYYKKGYGKVISTTVNMYIYICVSKKFDDLIRVSYSKTEIVETVDEIEHNIIREALKIAEIDKGVDIVYIGDVPLGSAGIGLASSSALAVGVLNALFAYKGMHVSAEFLAQKACEIEINILKNPIGKQDQYAVAYGGFSTYQFNSDESVYVNPVICRKSTLKKLNEHLLFFYTGLTRISSDILTEQKKNTFNSFESLDKLVTMVDIAHDSLVKNEIDIIGEMLDEAWQIKKGLSSNVSNEIIDQYYEKAKKAGAYGGKILGAGGGGFLMLYCPLEKQQNLRLALNDLKEVHIEFEPQGSKIIYVCD